MRALRALRGEDAALLARLHAAAFPRPWGEEAFATMLATPGVRAWGNGDGALLFRGTGEEGEILTLAVDPAARRRGLARALLARCIEEARRAGIRAVFLEVAEENAAARALYAGAHFAEIARRPDYYRGTGEGTDGLLLRLSLPLPA